MGNDPKPLLMTQSEYARHRGKSRQYISRLAKAGVLVMRGGRIDVEATDTVLDDKPVDDIDAPPSIQQPAGVASPTRPADGQGQGGATFGQARTIEMVFRAKLRRLEFETKQGKLIEAEGSQPPLREYNSHCGWFEGAAWDAEVRRVWRTQGSALYQMPCAGISRTGASHQELRVLQT